MMVWSIPPRLTLVSNQKQFLGAQEGELEPHYNERQIVTVPAERAASEMSLQSIDFLLKCCIDVFVKF